MLDWRGSGVSVMEMSHRSAEFGSIAQKAEADLRSLLSVPSEYRILFMQGGALAENAIVPLNLLRGRVQADYVNTGSWSTKSIREAARYCDVREVASGADSGFTRIPPIEQWQMRPEAAYLHICANETIDGLEYSWVPEPPRDVPLVADMSSNILSRRIDVARFGLIYAGAQKNIGPAGLTIVIVHDDLLGAAHALCPSAFNYQLVAQNQSMYNTPPTYAIYIAGLVFEWISRQREGALSGVAALEARNLRKAHLLYGALDATPFYRTRVVAADRSRMNVPFFLPDAALDARFLEGARERQLVGLKGHKTVGGMRASIYNAMPLAGVEALTAYLAEFARLHA